MHNLLLIPLAIDGEQWTSAALVGEAGIDLRDPRLSITPDDRLMIVAGLGAGTHTAVGW